MAACRCEMKIGRLSTADIFINLLHPLSVSCQFEQFQLCLWLPKFGLLLKTDSNVKSSKENSGDVPAARGTRDGHDSVLQESCACGHIALKKKKESPLPKQKTEPQPRSEMGYSRALQGQRVWKMRPLEGITTRRGAKSPTQATRALNKSVGL